MKLACLLALIPVFASAADDSPSDLNEKLRQTFAKITAYGEKARVCAGVMANDQAQLRDVQAKLRDAQDRKASLKREAEKLTAMNPRPTTFNLDYTQLSVQDANNNALIGKLSQQETALNNDAMAQQKCIDVAHAGLNSILTNPAQPVQDLPKKK